jgi:ParB/RepB/Spo0J family partition protein
MLHTGKTVHVKLAAVIVPAARLRRLRPEKVAEIAESFEQRGQIQPIVVVPDEADRFNLIVGEHRLRAAEKIGWQHIRAEVREGLDADVAELIEIDENLIRADLTDAERAMHLARRKALYEKAHPETKHGAVGRGRKKSSQNENSFVADTASKTGKGRSTVARDITRANKIVDLASTVGTSLDEGDELDALAKLPEDAQRDLIERAVAGEKVSARVRIKQVVRDERERKLGAKQCAWPIKKYGVIVADPEWDDRIWDSPVNRCAVNRYPVSDVETIKSRPVASIAADDAVLFLWSTNQHLDVAIDVLRSWGFEYASNYAWIKPSVGKGTWNRNRHEILLIGTRGNPPCPAFGTQWDSVIEAPRPGEHSAKPEIFLEMIEEYFPTLPKIELNRRGPARPGWDAWGNEAELPEETRPPAAESSPEYPPSQDAGPEPAATTNKEEIAS